MTAATLPIDAHDQRRRIFAIVGASSGNLVEWYDFYTFAFTAIYFAAAFFPAGNPTVQLLNTAAVFAAGFFMRPLGGWLFGWIADKHGRKNSMLISVLMMCGGSLLIAVLPTYATVGALAPVLLVIARLIQGLSVGGEYGTAATYMSEVATPGRRGFFSSFQYVTLIGGQLLASLVLVILQFIYTSDELKAWAWRIPFFIGAIAALVALFLRRALHETQAGDTMKSKEAGSLGALLRAHPRAFLIVVAFTAGGSLYFYTFTTYMQKYLVLTTKLPPAVATNLMTLVLFIYMCLQPPFGALSDRIGRRNSMLIYTSLAMICVVPLMYWIGDAGSAWAAFPLIIAGMIISSFYTSISGIVKAELFPAEVRALGVGFAYALGNAAFGGTAEYVALYFKNAGTESTFFWYVAVMALIGLIASLMMPDTRKSGGYLPN